MAQETDATRGTDRIAAALRFVPLALIHPVVLLSLFAPIFIAISLRLIRDNLENVQAGDHGNLLQLLKEPQVFGLVDYVIQYYTALLAAILLLRMVVGAALTQKFGIRVLISPKRYQSNGNPIPELVFAILFVIWFFFSLYVLLLGSAKVSVLNMYLTGAARLGEPSVPPLLSPLTWLRGTVALLAGYFMWLGRNERGK